MYEIREFTRFLAESLKKNVIEYSLTPLTKPGDNYGSVILSAKVKVLEDNEPHKFSVLHIVTKIAATNPYLVKLFQPSVTFVKEAHFYSDVIPAIELFEKSSNIPEIEYIDAFIRCLGSRLSLDTHMTVADADAVLLFENVKLLNYKNIDQLIGFDFDETLAIIKQMAKFHSICISMRRIQPELFNFRIRPYTNNIYANCKNDDGFAIIENICNGVRYIENLDPNLLAKVERRIKTLIQPKKLDTAYTTVAHKDFWSTNIMIKKDTVIRVKIYDFQSYHLESFAFDLIFFLFTSVRSNDLAIKFKHFISSYHTEFIKMLKFTACPLEEYTFEKMWHEIEEIAKRSLLFIFYIVKINFLKNDAPSSYDEVPFNMFLKGGPPSKMTLNRWMLIIDIFNELGFI